MGRDAPPSNETKSRCSSCPHLASSSVQLTPHLDYLVTCGSADAAGGDAFPGCLEGQHFVCCTGRQGERGDSGVARLLLRGLLRRAPGGFVRFRPASSLLCLHARLLSPISPLAHHAELPVPSRCGSAFNGECAHAIDGHADGCRAPCWLGCRFVAAASNDRWGSLNRLLFI